MRSCHQTSGILSLRALGLGTGQKPQMHTAAPYVSPTTECASKVNNSSWVQSGPRLQEQLRSNSQDGFFVPKNHPLTDTGNTTHADLNMQ